MGMTITIKDSYSITLADLVDVLPYSKAAKEYELLKRDVATDEKIAKLIHYPDCWDTSCYCTLSAALWEMVDRDEQPCPTCGKPQFQWQNHDEQEIEMD